MLEAGSHAMLIDNGVKLRIPSLTDEQYIDLLEDAEKLLGALGQDPDEALKDALRHTKDGLISDPLFKHSNMNVKVLVLSCIHELLRITAPEVPYEDAQMKEIFKQTLIVLQKNLTLFSGRGYDKALHILATMAKCKSCLIMQDLGCDAVVIKMFRLFLDSIRSNHPDAVFSNMEVIMTMLIKESDVLSIDFLKPVLTSAKKETQNISPPSWRLGVKVLKNCSDRVHPFLMKTVEKMRRNIEKYTDIVTSICPDVTAEENMTARGVHVSNLANISAQPEAIESGVPNSTRKPEEDNKNPGVSGAREKLPLQSKSVPVDENPNASPKRKQLSLEKSSESVPQDQDKLGRGHRKKKVNKKYEQEVKKEDTKGKTTAQSSDAEVPPPRSYKKSRGKEYGEELIGSRIKVWWSHYEKFYEGLVDSYDPTKKEHKVVYDDGDEETLKLKRERWSLLDDKCTKQAGEGASNR